MLSILAYLKFIISPNKRFVKEIRRILGFYPIKIQLYKIAVIHRSASIKTKKGKYINNERLEYLGDAILDSIISHILYMQFPEENEGFLTQMRSKIVNGENLSQLAKKIKLHKLIISNSKVSISHKNLYGDAFEAFIGALYLDSGYKKTFKFIENHILRDFVDFFELENENSNYKSQLIEWGQKYRKEVVFYTDLETPNSKYFISYIRIEGDTLGSGIGISKKEAEQKASKVALEQISTINKIK